TSRIATVYDTTIMLWGNNDFAFHVAKHTTRLRNYRGQSKASVASAMGTSQSAVARIEGGDENITLRTLKRLAEALDGRIRFAIEPQELSFPRWPEWWTVIGTPLGDVFNVPSEWHLHAAEERHIGGQRAFAAGWSTGHTTPPKELLSLGKAS